MDRITKAIMQKRRYLIIQTAHLVGLRSDEDVVGFKPVTVVALSNCSRVRRAEPFLNDSQELVNKGSALPLNCNLSFPG